MAEAENVESEPTRMPEATYIEADPDFVRDIMRAGGGTLKKCFQCATCSVVCPLSPEENPFPRKEMIWSQWGMKDRLLNDRDAWLCYQCNDCSSYCPRGAKPGEIMGAMRNLQIAKYSFPSFIAKAFSTPRYIWAVFAVPILLIALYFSIFGFHIPEGEVHFSGLIHHTHVEYAGFAVGAFVAITILIGLYRFWMALEDQELKLEGSKGSEQAERTQVDLGTQTRNAFIPSLISSVIEILLHNRFGDCETSKNRFYAHLGIFYGFIIVGISTMIAFIYLLMGRELGLPLTDPVKLIGNFGFILLFVGATWAIVERVSNKENVGIGGYFDWFFLGTLWIVTFTGILLEGMRFAEMVSAYWMYLVHLVFVFALLTYAPYSKFAHLAYRTIALTHAKFTGKDTYGGEVEYTFR